MPDRTQGGACLFGPKQHAVMFGLLAREICRHFGPDADKYDITKHPNYSYTADAAPKNAFNIEAFLSTRLTVKPGDTFVTFETDEREEEEPS